MSKALLWNQLGKAAGAPEQDTETETERGKKREGDCRAQIKFHCLFARPSPSLLLLPLPSTLPFLLLQEPGKTLSKPTRSRQHVSHCEIPISLKPNTSCQIWQPGSAQNKLSVHAAPDLQKVGRGTFQYENKREAIDYKPIPLYPSLLYPSLPPPSYFCPCNSKSGNEREK